MLNLVSGFDLLSMCNVTLFASDILKSRLSRNYPHKQIPKDCARSQQQTAPEPLTAPDKLFYKRGMYTLPEPAEPLQQSIHTNNGSHDAPLSLILPRRLTKTSTDEPSPRSPRERAAATLASARWQALWLTLGARAATAESIQMASYTVGSQPTKRGHLKS